MLAQDAPPLQTQQISEKIYIMSMLSSLHSFAHLEFRFVQVGKITRCYFYLTSQLLTRRLPQEVVVEAHPQEVVAHPPTSHPPQEVVVEAHPPPDRSSSR